MAPPLVSVIIPTFNRVRYVAEAIASVRAQRFTDYEIIVVDDGSTDNTGKLLASYGNGIRYFYQPNAGVGSARNAGVAVAKGRWIAFLDSDDEWMPDYLSIQVEHVEQDDGLCMQSTDCFLIDADAGSESYFELNGARRILGQRGYLKLDRPFRTIVEHSPWQLGATIFRKDSIVEVGGFDVGLTVSEDFDLMARVALSGPFALINLRLARIHRRCGAADKLSDQFRTDPTRFKLAEAAIYERLLSRRELNPVEEQSLRKILGMKRRAIGNAFRAERKGPQAREQYKSAFRCDRSLRSLGRYLSALPLG